MVTIIVPVYNVEEYLNKCIESIVNQSYKEIEIILVDDGSKDNSGSICDEWEKKDSRITVIHKKNGGLSSARNAGLNQSNGQYICFIDSDDWVEPDFIEVLFKHMVEHNADISQCGFVEDLEGMEGTPYRSENYLVFTGKNAIKNLYDRKTYLNTVVMWNKLFKKKNFQSLRFDEGIVHEDEALIHEVLYNADKVVVNESKLHHYLTRPNSIMNSKFNLKRLDIIYAYEKRLSYLKNKKEYELADMTMRMYFRVLLGVSSALFYSSLENKEIYLFDTTKKLDSIIGEIKKNKHLNNIDKILLNCYKVNKNAGFHANKSIGTIKNVFTRFA
ncbi:glycosyltransferase family 2 protein [Alkalibacter saccharofermentans]|uniref:Glycosyltransferase involved in cell wall bisynthesis n=1 Tax=Alkalibacter saccharofermentans DSM 14828 TaxID=1120975 RepID=A0A1M4ZWU9_9FIRM|nr:glycosyltransferase family 2 protein [Alkalibacter saccharofermentans]SHF22096.1 Glycosyltransferase involved in cell wall bisynthesis [Alkalibacter saccharofermentans DSM 14828]